MAVCLPLSLSVFLIFFPALSVPGEDLDLACGVYMPHPGFLC